MTLKVSGWCLLAGAVLSSSVAAPATEAPVEIILASGSPAYTLQLRASEEQVVRIRLRPEVRSVHFRASVERAERSEDDRVVGVELAEWPPPGVAEPPAIIRTQLARLPKTDRQPEIWRLYFSDVRISPHETDILWRLRVRSLPLREGMSPPPLVVGIKLVADARPITQRERDLMAWRAKIDPLTQPDAVRAKIAELTDEEVRHYTAFKDRANFLAMWRRHPIEELLTPEGGFRITDETRGILSAGNPLPDGKYLHHNGQPIYDP